MNVGVIPQTAQLFADVRGRQNKIHAARRHGAARHAVVLAAFRALGESDSAAGLNGQHPQSAIGGISGKDHANGAAPLFHRQGTQEGVDGHVRNGRVNTRRKGENAAYQAHVCISRDHINVIRFYLDSVRGLHHAHLRLALQQFREKADVLGIEMLDEDKPHASVGRQGLKQFRKCLQAAGRGSDSHDGENTVWRFVGLLRHERS